jgi:hypothetical protein
VLWPFFGFNCFNIGNGIALSLSMSDIVNLVLQTFRSLLGPPGMRTSATEKDFDLLNGLATRLGECKKELYRAKNTEGSEEQEKTVLDVTEGRRDEKTNGGIELSHVSIMGEQSVDQYSPASFRLPKYPFQ